jgi:hypothetical protein
MYVFSHLHKAAGTTMTNLLRRTFGWRHFDTKPARGSIYTHDDILYDTRRFGCPVSIAGHGLRPYVNFGELEKRMHWFTIVRNPLDRCISHYQHQVERMNRRCTFLEWISKNLHRNWMVYFYGGSDSLQSAIDALATKEVRVIDIGEGLRKGIKATFSEPLSWKSIVSNPAKSNRLRDEILNDDNLMAELKSANSLDMKLFSYMKNLKTEKLPPLNRSFPDSALLNTSSSFCFRNGLYRPVKMLQRASLKSNRSGKNIE